MTETVLMLTNAAAPRGPAYCNKRSGRRTKMRLPDLYVQGKENAVIPVEAAVQNLAVGLPGLTCS